VAEAPDFRGGYAGEPTFAGGGGYDPFDPKNYTGPVAPDFRGGYAGEPTAPGGGGFDPSSTRNIGNGTAEKAKPDGTKPIEGATPSNVNTGSAIRTTGTIPTSPFGTTEAAAVTPSILKSQSNAAAQSSDAIIAITPNPLELFASYTPLWTLACLESEQYNKPESYRNSPADLKHIVMSSAGRFESNRVQTTSGIPEYFINNFSMKATVGANAKTGNSNAFNFEWEIYEPYSMGLLLQSLQIAAKNAKFVNYLNDAVFVMRLDFQGYDELGRNYSTIKPKFFVLKITKVTFQVNEGGSTYKMTAVPYNHLGFSDTINTMFNDVKIVPKKLGTVEEALTDPEGDSLVAALNKIESDLFAAEKIGVKDIYDIQFPKDSQDFQRVEDIKKPGTATIDPTEDANKNRIQGNNAKTIAVFESNTIGKSSFGFNQSQGGNYPFRKHGDTVDEKTGLITRDNMTINPKTRTFQFSQGQTITAIINSIILSSQYAKAAMDPKNKINGYIKWFKLDVQIEMLDYDTKIGDFAKKFTYRVVPYLVHESIFTNPSTALEYTEIKKTITKGYNYIYTGKNIDVIKFDIEINNMFFTGVAPSPEDKTAQQNNPDQASGPAGSQKKSADTGQGPAALAVVASGGRSRPMRDPELLKKEVTGGAGIEDTAQKVAQSFHKAFTQSSTEMVTVNLEILGDPYWVVDSGMGNYFAKPTVNNQVTEDGTMNYESGDVFVYLTFKTPSDVNTATGLYDFGKEVKVSPYSGIYRVTAVESMFNESFRQRLRLVRMPGQAIDYTDNPPEVKQAVRDKDKSESMSTTIGGPMADRISITDPIVPSILVSTKAPVSPSTNANAVPGQAAISTTPGQAAPDFRGGYVPGSASVASGGGYDPATGTFASNSANSIGGAAAISKSSGWGSAFASAAIDSKIGTSGFNLEQATQNATKVQW
jgi:hypothetical protein